MPTVAISRTVARARPAPRHPKAVIVTERGHKVVLPYAPEGGSLTGFGWDWTVTPRPQRRALVTKGGHRNKTYTYVIAVCHPNPQISVEPVLTALRYIVDLGERVSWTGMGPSERGLYRLSLDSINPTRRQHGTNHITQCSVTLTFVEAVDAVTKVGPLSGGA